MKYLIESDRAIDYLNGRSDATQLLQSIAHEGLVMSVISYGEIYEGIYFGSDPRRREHEFQRFLRAVRVLPLSRSTLQQFARIRGLLRQRGTPIGVLDILVAAMSLQHGLTIVTRNRRHFDRVPGLAFYEET